MHLKTLYCAICPALLLLPKHLCSTETDVQTLNCSHSFGGHEGTQQTCCLHWVECLQNLVFYTDTEKHIWHNHSRTAGCDQMPGKVSMSLPALLLLGWLVWYIVFHSAIVISKLPLLSLFFFLIKNCCWDFITLTLKWKKN